MNIWAVAFLVLSVLASFAAIVVGAVVLGVGCVRVISRVTGPRPAEREAAL